MQVKILVFIFHDIQLTYLTWLACFILEHQGTGISQFQRHLWPWYAGNFVSSLIPIQDTIHEGVKLRTRLLKREKYLVLGQKIASPTDLETLVRRVGKDLHLLREEDLNLRDKMKYDAVVRLCQPHLIDLLRRHVPGNIFSRTNLFKM